MLKDTDAYVAGYKSLKRVDRVDECKGYIRNMNAFFNFRISEKQANVRQYCLQEIVYRKLFEQNEEFRNFCLDVE